MKIFHALKALTDYRKRHMPFVKTLEDLDILREIGLHQEAGNPITLKVLYLQGISSVATVQRRLSRLKRLGVVHESRAIHDKRLVKLTLDSTFSREFSRMYALMRLRMEPPGRTSETPQTSPARPSAARSKPSRGASRRKRCASKRGPRP